MADAAVDLDKRMANVKQEYDLLATPAARLCEELKHQIGVLLEQQHIRLAFPLMARVKGWSSISQKLGRGMLQISKLGELWDFVGVRAVTVFARDCIAVSKLVEKTFRVIQQDDKRASMEADRFGYASLHFVVRPPQAWLTLPSLEGCENLRVEIQVRTLAQHTWAEVSHTLQYKQERDVPKSLQRSIFRASALLELVDLEFDRVLDERERLRKSQTYVLGDSRLNRESLAAIMSEMLPTQNRVPDEDYSEILDELEHFGIMKADQLRQFLAQHLAALGNVEKARIDSIRLNGPTDTDEQTALETGIFFSHTGLLRLALERQFGEGVVIGYQLSKLDSALKATVAGDDVHAPPPGTTGR